MSQRGPDIAFGPAGTKTLFSAGVSYYILKYFPIRQEKIRIYTVSGGFMGACLLFAKDHNHILEMAKQSAKIAGTLLDMENPHDHLFTKCVENLQTVLPDNVHQLIGDRLSVGCSSTTLPPKAVTLSGPFDSKDDVIQAGLSSSYIPIFMKSRGPYTKWSDLIDGGFTHNLPPVDKDTLTIGPSDHGQNDICYPFATNYNLELQTAEVYMSYFWSGVEMAQRSHDLIERKLRSRGLLPKIGYVPKKNF